MADTPLNQEKAFTFVADAQGVDVQGDIVTRLGKELEGETSADAVFSQGSKCVSSHWLLSQENFALISASNFSSDIILASWSTIFRSSSAHLLGQSISSVTST
jgi:hypothetical protein